MAQFDKRDVEAMGLVKLDVLGLRMLATLSEAEETICRHKDPEFDVDSLPRGDTQTYNLIRSGDTVGLFQIESQGQHHLLAQHQPEEFQDLISQVALFRPGPLQGSMVRPYVRRRRGQEPVTYDHPSLEPILKDTYGIILFQEQLLEVAHRFAGMSLEEADRFRDEISEARDSEDLKEMREQFVGGAVENGVPQSDAEDVFEKVSGFVGYGFCRSHAAAFAETVYQSAYLKAHHPAAFLAAVMTHRPGMYSQMTLEEEARRFDAEIRGPDLHRSSVRFDIEPTGDGWAIRKPLTSVEEVSSEDARTIIFERLNDSFESVEDLYRRVNVEIDVLRNLAKSGALADISRDGRTALWEVGVLHERLGSPGRSRQPKLFEEPALLPEDVPDLPELTERERLSWDLETHRAARRHPMTLVRRQLTDLEIRPIETCQAFGTAISVSPEDPPPKITVAGLSILRQRPSTANGVMFLTLEDETGYIQCVCQPEIRQAYGHVLRGGAVIARGKLQIEGNWRGLVLTQAWRLDGIFGGYEGHASASGGRDRWVRQAEEAEGHSSP
jgi:error-prone DNA polymerase